MNVHAKSIRYFDAICRSGSIREAARRLHVDASAVNRQLLNLEEDIGAALFERLPGGLRLTEAGEIFARHVVTVLQDEQRALAELARLRGIERGEARVCAAESLSVDFLPAAFERMMQRYPNVHLQTDMLGSASIAAQVLNGETDIGVAFALPHHPELRCVGHAEFRLGAIMAPDHPLAAKGDVSFAECAVHPLILTPPDFAIHTLLAPLMDKMNPPARPVVHSGSIELMRQLAMRGLGIAFQTRIGLAPACAAGHLAFVSLRDAGLSARLGIYVRAARALPPAVDVLVAIMNDELARLAREDAASPG